LIEEVTAHVQRDSLEDAREICADGTYFLNNLRILVSSVGSFFSYPACCLYPCPDVLSSALISPQCMLLRQFIIQLSLEQNSCSAGNEESDNSSEMWRGQSKGLFSMVEYK